VDAIEAALAECPVEHEIVVTSRTVERGLRGVVEATNFLAEKAVAERWDYLWVVEADVEVPKHALRNLLQGDADINLGVYPNHREDLRLMAGYFEEQNNCVQPVVHSVFDLEKLKGRIFTEMVWAGIGCALIRRRVFEGLRFVYDRREYRRKLGVHDQLFLFEAQRLGFRVFLHGDVVCGHLPEWPLQKLEAKGWGLRVGDDV